MLSMSYKFLTSLGSRIAKCLSNDNATVINTDAHIDTLAKASKNSRILAKNAEIVILFYHFL